MNCEFCNKRKLARKLKCVCKYVHYTCTDCKLAFLNNWHDSYENEFNVDCTEQLSPDTIRFYDKMINKLDSLINTFSGRYKSHTKYYKYCMECLEGEWMPTDLEFSFDMVVSIQQQERYNTLGLK